MADTFPHVIEAQPDFAFVRIQVPEGGTLKVEGSSMATMSTNMSMKTKMKGGLGRLLTREGLFLNEFSAEGGPGEIGVAPGTPGDIRHVRLEGEALYLQGSAFLASGMDVEVDYKWQGMRRFFSGESMFLIRCSGHGDLWFNSYGAIIPIDVRGGYVVDTGHIVAFTEGLNYEVERVGGYKSLFFSGEGFVCRFSGEGKVWIQTRVARAFAWWADAYRPVESESDDD